ncbi:MAG: MBL fold metallo-hydrolase, partial [Roseiflexaceae bacterium]
MEIAFLGGASGVGASCLALDIAGRRVLIDAGVRMDPTTDRLPDLAQLDRRDLAAIFVTHAHADHIGALPLVHQHFPATPIYASPATIRLMEVMLADALRVMERRATEELEIPLYDAALVASMLRLLRPLPLGEQRIPELPNVTISVTRAGHVAGAVGLGFAAPDGRLVISGDVSMTPQRTILGAAVPSLRHPDLLILESTYGARMHPNRQAEERRLAQAVAEGVQNGHVLVPAFALG